jgi:hypothetical protein
LAQYQNYTCRRVTCVQELCIVRFRLFDDLSKTSTREVHPLSSLMDLSKRLHEKSLYCLYLSKGCGIIIRFPNLFASCRDTFSKGYDGRRGRVEECSVAPLCNKKVKTLCGCREEGIKTKTYN